MAKMSLKVVVMVLVLFVLVCDCCQKKEKKMENSVKMDVFNLEVEKGHFIANINGKRVIVDTGAPNSGGTFQSNIWGKVDKKISETGLLLKPIQQLSGISFDAIVGTDCLLKYNLTINLKEKKMVVTNNDVKEDGEIVPCRINWFIPELTLKIDGKEVPAFFDTGAIISYFPPETFDGLTPIGEYEDFFPILGKFKTPLYIVDVQIGNMKTKAKAGILPFLLRASLAVTGTNAVFGNEIFDSYEVTFLNLQK